MDSTLEAFQTQREGTASVLRDLLSFIQAGQDFGVVLDEAFEQKLANAIGVVTGERLKVTLVGGFSEGKTSIAAAWMNRLDREGMKISQKESTDQVQEYPVGDDLLLVDTPGLFGFREIDGQSYRDLTRKYVSEANLVLYVMDPTNPIKESHQAELEWLFRDLRLLSRTVFVLSRFDAVADLEDDASYQSALDVKRAGVRQRLTDLIGLDAQETENLSIVAVSANPFEQGIDYWLENPDEHRQLSRIGTLQNATATRIQASGGTQRLVAETRTAIIGDVLGRHLPIALDRSEQIASEVDRLEDAINELIGKLERAERQAGNAVEQIRSFLIEYFPGLILQARGADMQTWNTFFEREVGAEGIIIRMRLQEEYGKRLRTVQLNLQSVQGSFVNEISHFNTMVSSMGKQGVQFLLDGDFINNKSVLLMRDGIVSAGRMVGVDLSKNLKFAPWGARNLANNVTSALPLVSLALEAWDSYRSHEREQQFRAGVNEFVTTLERQRASLVEELDGKETENVFFKTYFPELLEMYEFLSGLKSALADLKAKQERFVDWHQQAGVLEGEYKLLCAG